MSWANLFQPILGRLRKTKFGRIITDQEGERRDTGVQALAEELALAFGDMNIEPEGQVVFQSNLSVPPFRFLDAGGAGAIFQFVTQAGDEYNVGAPVVPGESAERTFQGTTNQVNVSDDGMTVTFSTPQDIDAEANVEFATLELNDLGASGQIPFKGTPALHGGSHFVSKTGFSFLDTGTSSTSFFGLNYPIKFAPNSEPTTGGAEAVAALWAQDVAGTTEIRVKDSAGNVTTISPHVFELQTSSETMAWSYHSERIIGGRRWTIEVDMLRALRVLERVSGETLVLIRSQPVQPTGPRYGTLYAKESPPSGIAPSPAKVRARAARGVAVIVTCHNYGHFLADALESVLRQTVRAAEVLVVDDASTDNTKEVADSFASRGVKYLRVDVRRVNLARKAGLLATNSPVVLFLDADDELADDYLAQGEPLFDDPQIGIVYSDCELFGDETGRLAFPDPTGQNMLAQNFAHAGSLLRRSALEASLDAFDAPVTRRNQDDWALWRKLWVAGWRCAKQKGLYLYRRHGGSHTTELRRNLCDYYDLAACELETVTVFLPLSGRSIAWTRLEEWLDRQTWPKAQVRLVVADCSQDKDFNAWVRANIFYGKYADVRVYSQVAGRPQLANEDRRVDHTKKEVRTAMCRIYNRMAQEATTEYVLVLEDDITPPLDVIERLLRSMDDDVASVSGAYRSRYEPRYVAWERPGVAYREKGQGAVRVGGNGFGCVLLRTSILRKQVFQHGEPFQDYDFNFYDWLARETKHRAILDWSVECEHADYTAKPYSNS